MIIQGTIAPEYRSGIQNLLAYSAIALTAGTHHGTFHRYETELPSWLIVILRGLSFDGIRSTILRHQPLHYQAEPIHEMNELYVSALGAGGSDKVFETDHVDGPFWCLPGASVYRCIVGVSENLAGIQTRFTHQSVTVNQYTFLAFDYNRDIHAIQRDLTVQPPCTVIGPRVTFKLHYICYSPRLPRAVVVLYKWMHIGYNSLMRRLFLAAQTHRKTWYARCLSFAINQGTVGYCALVKMVTPRP